MHILLTGFEPFGGSDINSSWETAAQVAQMPPKDFFINLACLPVSFEKAGRMIREMLRVHKPDVLIMLGQRGNGQSIDIERIAVNLMDSAKPDNDGDCPQEQAIVWNGQAAYFSNLPVKELRDAVLQKNIPSKVSNNAGLYVCNCTYYNALNEIYEHQLPTRAVFVHLPKLSQDFPVELLAESVKTIIEKIQII